MGNYKVDGINSSNIKSLSKKENDILFQKFRNGDKEAKQKEPHPPCLFSGISRLTKAVSPNPSASKAPNRYRVQADIRHPV